MKIEITVEAEYTFDIQVNDSILDEVARYYDGDFRRWAKDNYNEYFDASDMDIELDRCDYDNNKAKELLKKVREIIGSSDEDLSRIGIDREKLRHSVIDTLPDNLKEIEIDLDLLYQVLPFVDVRNPKYELNYIHLDGNVVEATDTRKLIKIYNHKYSYDNLFFPSYFLEPLKNGAKLFLSDDERLYLKHEDTFYKGIDDQYSKPTFPDTKRIIKDDIYNSDVPRTKFKDLEIKKVLIGLNEKPCFQIVFNNDKYYFNDLHFLPLEKFDVEFVGTYSKDYLKPYPFFFFNKEHLSICIMPLYLKDDEKVIEVKEKV